MWYFIPRGGLPHGPYRSEVDAQAAALACLLKKAVDTVYVKQLWRQVEASGWKVEFRL